MIVHPLSVMAERLPELVDQVARDQVQIGIEIDGDVQVVLLSLREYESMRATIEFLSDPAAVAAFEEGRRDIEAGRVIDEAGLEALRVELEARLEAETREARGS